MDLDLFLTSSEAPCETLTTDNRCERLVLVHPPARWHPLGWYRTEPADGHRYEEEVGIPVNKGVLHAIARAKPEDQGASLAGRADLRYQVCLRLVVQRVVLRLPLCAHFGRCWLLH